MSRDRDRRHESGVERIDPQGRPPHLQDRGGVLYPLPTSCRACGRTAPGPLDHDALVYICRPVARIVAMDPVQREVVCLSCWLVFANLAVKAGR